MLNIPTNVPPNNQISNSSFAHLIYKNRSKINLKINPKNKFKEHTGQYTLMVAQLALVTR